MKFGPVPLDQAVGHILAHSLSLGGNHLAKGLVLSAANIETLRKLDQTTVTVAQMEPDDLDENVAARQLAACFDHDHIKITEPFSGRVNLIARTDGLIRVNAARIAAFNSVDQAITIATLPDYARVHQGSLIATIKIIPYAVPVGQVQNAIATICAGATLELHPFTLKTAALILTSTPGFKPSLLTKGEAAVRVRTSALGLTLVSTQTVAHTQSAITAALAASDADITLILGASATSDRNDVAPAALIDAGGILTRFGMPVDPGNLLFLGELNGKPVVGLPGCARSPALNGADWVIERLAAAVTVDDTDIAAMGVGGLLKEVPARPLPRRSRAKTDGQAHILLLAAGKSSRMRGDNKLLRVIDGQPLVARTAARLCQSNASGVTVVINPDIPAVKTALADLPVAVLEAQNADAGLSASLRAGLLSLPKSASAVIIALADMPDITDADINALIAAHDPEKGAYIVAPTAPNGKRGNPVLFDQRYFETLATLTGDTGAKALIDAQSDALVLVKLGFGVLTDLDTPEAWDAWLADRQNSATQG